jgi:hypothetical protein
MEAREYENKLPSFFVGARCSTSSVGHMEPAIRNPFAPPSAVVEDRNINAALLPNARLYSPRQIRIGTFLGGPIAAVYLLRANFLALNRTSEAHTTILCGIALLAGLLVLVPFLPKHFPNFLIPILISIAAGFVADKWQLSKQAIVDSGSYEFQSNWRLLGITLLSIIAFLLIIVVGIVSLTAFGQLHL